MLRRSPPNLSSTLAQWLDLFAIKVLPTAVRNGCCW
jgi:hypothetical protein